MAGTAQASRLQKLLNLLGSNNEYTRKAAAKQVGEVAKTHPQQLPAILRKVRLQLLSKNWSTRAAAGEAVGHITDFVAHHTVQELLAAAAAAGHAVQVEDADAPFSTFNLQLVLDNGKPLVASGGQEYDEPDDGVQLPPGQRLKAQRAQLKKRLGLDASGAGAFMDTDELFGEEDLVMVGSNKGSNGGGGSQPGKLPSPKKTQTAADLLASMEGLSARERNKLKRRAKALNRCDSGRAQDVRGAKLHTAGSLGTEGSVGGGGSSLSGGASKGQQPPTGRAAAAGGAVAGDEDNEEELEQEWQAIAAGGWPLQSLCDQLTVDVLDPVWETRHGAAIGLREVLRAHAACAAVECPAADDTSGWLVGGSAGKRRLGPVSAECAAAAKSANAAYLEDCIMLLLAVLALDRFADYGSDQAVAPVRETAAQALGAASQPLEPRVLAALLTILQQLKSHGQWEVRHSGLAGIKYLLAARVDVSAQLLPLVLPMLQVGLQDRDDDVRAAAADALVPVVSQLSIMGSEVVDSLRNILWDILPQLEELSAATSSVMHLLSHLYQGASGAAVVPVGPDTARLVPRLFPFLRHPLSGVRLSSISCLERLVTPSATAAAAAGGGSSGLEATSVGGWMSPELQRGCLRMSYQNLLLESDDKVLSASLRVFRACLDAGHRSGPAALSAADVHCMMAAAATPTGRAHDKALLLAVSGTANPTLVPLAPSEAAAAEGRPSKRARTAKAGSPLHDGGELCHIDADMPVGGFGEGSAARMRMAAADALGRLCYSLQSQGSPLATQELQRLLQQPAATARLAAALIMWYWMQAARDAAHAAATTSATAPEATSDMSGVPAPLLELCTVYLTAPGPAAPTPPTAAPYAELAASYAKMRREMGALMAANLRAGWQLHTPNNMGVDALTADAALAVIGTVIPAAEGSEVYTACQVAYTTAATLQVMEAYLHAVTTAALAAVVALSGQLPLKLNMVIQPLMHSLRKDPDVAQQQLSAAAIAELLALLAAAGKRGPADKLVHNICSMACADPADTPSATAEDVDEDDARLASHAQASTSAARNGGSSAAAAAAHEAAAAAQTTRRGGELALQRIAYKLQAAVFQQLPSLWTQIGAPLDALRSAAAAPAAEPAGATAASGAADATPPPPDPQALINSLQILKVTASHLDPAVQPTVLALLPSLCLCSRHSNGAVRLAAARCAVRLADNAPNAVLPTLLRLLLPLLEATSAEHARVGAVQVIRHLIATLSTKLVPYAVLLTVPLLRRMADPSPDVRRHATSCFGSLVALLPLAHGQPPPPGLDAAQLAAMEQDGGFLAQLLDNRHVGDYKLPVELKVQLRPYQQEGINWLAFLRRFGLHGVLADDMGLGKTLQATATIACATAEQAARYRETGDPADKPLPSLVVCPSTLVDHWAFEISKYVAPQTLRPLAIAGTPSERAAAQRSLPRHNVVVMSYEALRADVEWVAGVSWCYCVLDEGHVIRSPRTKLSLAVKRLSAQHRLLLSGTPVQNSLGEVWSLFDFLMPGFLGSERAFNAKYGKAVQAARYSKRGSKENEAGMLAADSLHKQVTPFVLRRTKQQVLQDLPPKIIQDVMCQLSAVQRQLYEDFTQSAASSGILAGLAADRGSSGGGGAAAAANGGGDAKKPSANVFQALHYLRRLCSHPLLALNWAVPEHRQAVQKALQIADQATAERRLRELVHAPKLLALRDILMQCNIIDAEDSGGGSSTVTAAAEEAALLGGDGCSAADSGHRLLVFAQLKGTLDRVEQDLLLPYGVTFMRLDGDVEASARFAVVQKFNADPTIQVLLLTTHVGGLGLNLTSADTVVFLEHDWNPAKDLQAMDRAHRLGQTRTVNVYRLITAGTLEEKIMGLQAFKTQVANQVVNQDNMSLSTMDTTQLLDLFSTGDGGAGAGPGQHQQQQQQQQQQAPDAQGASGLAGTGRRRSAVVSMLEGMGEMWGGQEYEQEFDVQGFMQRMGKKTS